MSAIATLAGGSTTMTSREIAELTGKNHADVMRDIRIMVEQLTKAGLLSCAESTTYAGKDGRQYPQYELDKDTCLNLLLGYDAVARMKVVKRWQELESAKSPSLPQTFAQALRLAAEQQEQIEAQQLKIESDRPKVEYADALLNSDGTTLVRDVAKTLGVGPMKLHKALKEKGVILGNNAPAARYVEQGYFVESIHTYETTTAGARIAHAARVTGRGIEFIRRFVARHGELLTRRPAKGVTQ